jgi:hypothetical protein
MGRRAAEGADSLAKIGWLSQWGTCLSQSEPGGVPGRAPLSHWWKNRRALIRAGECTSAHFENQGAEWESVQLTVADFTVF